MEALNRRDVSVAADRVIEAIRMYAAQNGGHLPQALSEITAGPVPVTPESSEPPFRTSSWETEPLWRFAGSLTRPESMRGGDYLFEITIAHDRQ